MDAQGEFRERPGAAAAALAGLSLGLALGPRLRPSRPPGDAPRAEPSAAAQVLDASFAVRLSRPASLGTSAPAAAPAGAAAPDGAAEPLRPASLRELLRAQRGCPEARSFAAAFQADGALMRVWNDYEDDGDSTGMIMKLRASPEFHRLLATYMKSPAFAASVNALLMDPRFSRAVREADARLSAGAP